MKLSPKSGALTAGAAAGIVNGLLGTGGGIILIPLLSRLTDIEEADLFSASVAIILPVCLVSLTAEALGAPLPWMDALPYLLGSSLGGILTGLLGKKLPLPWLHRIFGGLILLGGVRLLF